jgi:hypothetical protein
MIYIEFFDVGPIDVVLETSRISNNNRIYKIM